MIVECDNEGTPLRTIVTRAYHTGRAQWADIVGLLDSDPNMVVYRCANTEAGRVRTCHHAWFQREPEHATGCQRGWDGCSCDADTDTPKPRTKTSVRDLCDPAWHPPSRDTETR